MMLSVSKTPPTSKQTKANKSPVNQNQRRLFPEERWQRIEALIKEDGRVSVDNLSSLFAVSKVTIRSDLDELERRGVLMRTHGGAVAVDVNRAELTFTDRIRVNLDAKKRIGEAAAALV